MSDNAPDRKAQTRAMFDRVAADYDAGGPGCFARFGERLVEITGVEPGQRVLDVATGHGAALFPAAERAGTEGKAIGIDLSGEMARIASNEAARRGLHARIMVGDAEELDFPDASFDRVLCGFGVMFFPRLDCALNEFHRVLKPEGRLGFSTWRVSQVHDLGAVLAQLGLADMSDDPALRFRDPADLERPLVAAGFTGVNVQIDTVTFRYTNVEQYWQNARGTGMRRAIESLSAEQAQQTRAVLAGRFQSRTQPDGVYVEAAALIATASR